MVPPIREHQAKGWQCTVHIIGPWESGVKTLAGSLFYRSGSISHLRGEDFGWLLDQLQPEPEGPPGALSFIRYLPAQLRRNGLPNIRIRTPRLQIEIVEGLEVKRRYEKDGHADVDVTILVVGPDTMDALHPFIVENASTMIRCSRLIVAVNKMDTVAWNETVFDQIVMTVKAMLTSAMGASPRYEAGTTFIPISAWTGDNTVSVSENSPWYERGARATSQYLFDQGCVLEAIETVPLDRLVGGTKMPDVATDMRSIATGTPRPKYQTFEKRRHNPLDRSRRGEAIGKKEETEIRKAKAEEQKERVKEVQREREEEANNKEEGEESEEEDEMEVD